jgi:hypothetical protein
LAIGYDYDLLFVFRGRQTAADRKEIHDRAAKKELKNSHPGRKGFDKVERLA